MIAFIAYLLTIPAANLMIENVGTTCIPSGPCLLPVGFGLMAPSGVYMAGLALVLRDFVQREIGKGWSLVAIALGAALSAGLAPLPLAIASALAFGLSELLDFAIYTPLARRRFITALVVSSAAGAVADSALFLWLAFGGLDHIAGQLVGKAWMIAAAAVLIWISHQRRSPDTGGAG
jgi:uncharacterized PurR-regulated membrane protein YhhQ (DUF165 family)